MRSPIDGIDIDLSEFENADENCRNLAYILCDLLETLKITLREM